MVSRKVPTFPNLAKLTMRNDYYTYAWLREDGTPYYIGKGAHKRSHQRYGRNNKRKPPKDENRILILKRNLTEEEAFRHECYMIAILGRKDQKTGILINLTDGGEGRSGALVSEETRKKMSETRKGRVIPAEQRALISRVKSCWWLLTFKDGKEIEVKNLYKWAKENNYWAGRLSQLSKGDAKSHKDIISVKKLVR